VIDGSAATADDGATAVISATATHNRATAAATHSTTSDATSPAPLRESGAARQKCRYEQSKYENEFLHRESPLSRYSRIRLGF
jgi:hypothetical protein